MSEVIDVIDKRFNAFLSKCTSYSEQEMDMVLQSFERANEANKNFVRENGDPFIYHAIAVAEILTDEMGLTATTVGALFTHEAQRENKLVDKLDEKVLGKDVLQIASDLNKISSIDIKTTSLQVENFRKLIVSLSPDPRVILIKLADRLEVMRSLSFFPKSKQLKKAHETLLLYAPLAHQLGLYRVKSEMEDLSLRYIEPEQYRSIVTKLRTSDKERTKFIADFVKPIELELKNQGLSFEIKSRTKSVYSIWRKMKQQQVPFEGVYDVFAIRIVLDSDLEHEKPDCWKAYSIVTNIYTPNTKRLRDWLSAPKSSGYESLHITVDTPNKRTVEVQIRSVRMDEIAENGIAAHWRYKGVKQLQGIQSWLGKVKGLLSSPSQEIDQHRSLQELKHDEIFVFTPNGDLRQLPAGASVLDFAFDIHTNLGSRCVGARVNGKNTTIKERLKTGDVVEIQTAKNQVPKTDWLNFVITSKARTRIKQRMREEETKLAGMGRELLERRLKNWKLTLNDEILSTLVKYYKLKVITDLYAQIAAEKINLSEIKDLLYNVEKGELKTNELPEVPTKTTYKRNKEHHVDYLEIDESLNNVSFKLAKCCNPIFGDDIFGFVTIKDGVKIHRVTCPNAARLLERYDYRIVKTKWREHRDRQSFQANLWITGYDTPGIVAHINDVIMHDTGISMRSFNITNNKKGAFEARLQVYLNDKKQLDMLIVHLQKIKGVEKIVRLSN